MMQESDVYTQKGRSLKGAALLLASTAVLIAATAIFEITPVITGFLFLFLLPLVWDLIRNPISVLSIDETKISWQRGALQDEIFASDIVKTDLHIKFDGSAKLFFTLTNGKTQKVPVFLLPKAKTLEVSLEEKGYAPRRHPFSLF